MTVALLALNRLRLVKQVAVDDRLMFTLEDFTLIDDLSDVEAVAQKIGDRSAGEGNAASGSAG